MVARISWTPCDTIMLAVQLALRTESHTLRITLLFEEFEARIVIRELGGKVSQREPQFDWNVLFDFHRSILTAIHYQLRYLMSRDNYP